MVQQRLPPVHETSAISLWSAAYKYTVAFFYEKALATGMTDAAME